MLNIFYKKMNYKKLNYKIMIILLLKTIYFYEYKSDYYC